MERSRIGGAWGLGLGLGSLGVLGLVSLGVFGIAAGGVTASACRAEGPAAARVEEAPGPAAVAGAAGEERWVKPPDEVLRKKLGALAYRVTQEEATEPPFQNAFWDHHAEGLYVDVVTGEPLFSSKDKFDSGTGWPSFTRPVDPKRVRTKTDRTFGMARTEVRSAAGDSHLGHVFDDGPAPEGLRYCINSAALRFVPVEKLVDEGYGAWRSLFGGVPGATVGSAAAGASADGGAASNTCTEPPAGQAPGCASSFEVAILAGGCFWGMEDILRDVPGVVETEVGYTGGKAPSPTYDDLHGGRSGHAEAVRVVFDPAKLSYADLLERWFFRMHDPTTKDRQGNDVGSQYRSAIFTTSPGQARVAAEVRARVDRSGKWPKPVVTEIAAAGPFTPAEAHHQDYLERNPGGYTCHFLRD